MTTDSSEKTGDATTRALATALHDHVQAIAKRPLDAPMLMEIEQTCRLARQLLAVGKMPDAFQKQHGLLGNGASYVNALDVTGSGMTLPAPSNPTETFGVQAIKELVALIPGLIQKPAPVVEETAAAPLNYSELAQAMAIARGSGDDKLYAQLMTLLEADQRRAELANKKLEFESKPTEPPVESNSVVVPKLLNGSGEEAVS